MLREPILYLSLFFKTHRSLYYEHLQAVCTKGTWEEWLAFFLEGVTECEPCIEVRSAYGPGTVVVTRPPNIEYPADQT